MGRCPDKLSPTTYGRLLETLLEQAGGYALSILHNRSDAEDAVQQAALRGLERLDRHDPARPFKGWWFTILRNCCIDLLRARRRNAVLIQSAEPKNDCWPDQADWRALVEAMKRLDSQQAEILRLRYFGGLTYEELAETLEIPKGTVMSRLHYARKALACQMRDSEP